MKILIIGASGFVGKALAKRLLSDGHQVVCLSRKEVPELMKLGAEYFREDISAPSINFPNAFKNIETVFHTAARVDMWGRYKDFYATNVTGTKNVLEAALDSGVKKFIFTSSPSVIADGSNLRGIDEQYPYPKSYKAYYPETKAIAEKMVLAANRADFFTLALRPHLIFGPGDTNLTPTIISRAKEGKLAQIGRGGNIVDFTYIDDCVEAHVNAMKALNSNPNARGRAYFITQGDPVLMWEWINKLLEMNGIQKVTKKIPYLIAYMLAAVGETFGRVLSLKDVKLTRFLVSEMATDHYFSIKAAREELGYNPGLKTYEALERFSTQRNEGNKGSQRGR